MAQAKELLVEEIHLLFTSIDYTSRLAITILCLPSDTSLKGFLVLNLSCWGLYSIGVFASETSGQNRYRLEYSERELKFTIAV